MFLRRCRLWTWSVAAVASIHWGIACAERIDVAPLDSLVKQRFAPTENATEVGALANRLNARFATLFDVLNSLDEADKQGKAIDEHNTLLGSSLSELKETKNEVLAITKRQRGMRAQAAKGAASSYAEDKVEKRYNELLIRLDAVLKAKTKDQRHSAVNQALASLRQSQTVEQASRVFSNQPMWVTTSSTFPQKIDTVEAPLPKFAKPIGPTEDRVITLRGRERQAGSFLRTALANQQLASADPPAAEAQNAASCGYTANDLSLADDEFSGVDAAGWDALAQQYQYSAAQIFQYVANGMQYEPYYGSLKGARGVLLSKAGNSTDQASLLIALLRASQIPARYVKAEMTLQLSDTRFLRWLGAVTPQGVKGILNQARIPYTEVKDAQGNVVAFNVQHTFAEACVPYGVYRGTSVARTSYRWVPLDPSFKDYVYQAGISTDISFDYATYLSKQTRDLPHEAYERLVEQDIKSRAPYYSNNTLRDVPYRTDIRQLNVDVLPVSLPYAVNKYLGWGGIPGNNSETASLPSGHRYVLNAVIRDAITNNTLLDTTGNNISMPKYSLTRIILGFDAYIAGDLTTWQNNGNAYVLPCGVQVKPVIQTDTVKFGTGTQSQQVIGTGSLDACQATATVELKLQLGDFTDSQISVATFSGMTVGSISAIAVDAYQASAQLIQERAKGLLDVIKQSSTNGANANLASLYATEGELLNVVGLKFFNYSKEALQRIADIDHGSGLMEPGIALVSGKPKVEYLMGVPFWIGREGFTLAAPNLRLRNSDLSTGLPSWRTLKLAAYSIGTLQGYVWQENLGVEALTPVSGIQNANETGVEVLTLADPTSPDFAKLTSNSNSTLNYPSNWVNGIKNLVGPTSNYVVTAPRRLIQYKQWIGGLWTLERSDPAKDPTGKSEVGIGFMMGGMAAGGYTLADKPRYGYTIIQMTGFNTINRVNDADPRTYFERSSAVSLGASRYNIYGLGGANLVNGNKFFSNGDINIKGRGLPFALNRSYNSGARKENGPLGYGWTHSYNQYLNFRDDNYNGTEDPADADGMTSSAVWIDGTGAGRYVQVQGSSTGVSVGSAFTTPDGFYFQMSREADGTYKIRDKGGLIYIFESVAGTLGNKARLTKIIDRNNNSQTLSYDAASGQLVKVTDDLNRSLTFSYDSGNRITSIKDWTNRSWGYGYDAITGDLTSYTLPPDKNGTAGVITYTYYTTLPLEHALKSYALPKSNGMTYEYYMDGRLFKQYNSKGETTSYSYNDYSRETIVINERGFKKRILFSADGQPINAEDENGNEVSYQYDPLRPFVRTSSRNTMGYITYFDTDVLGNVTKITKPSGATIESSYFNAYNQPGRIKDPNGNYTIYKYDSRGNLLQAISLKQGIGASIDPNLYNPNASDIVAWSIKTYDAYGNVLTSKQIRNFAAQVGPTLEYDYNDVTNNVQGLNAVKLTRRGDKDGNGTIDAAEFESVNLAYDSLGRQTQGITDSWYPTQAFYDNLDRVYRSTDSNGRLRDTNFDANGNVQTVGLTVGGTLLDQSTTSYDSADRKTSVTSWGGFIVKYDYDAAGNVVKVTNPEGYAVGYAYDIGNHVVMAYDEAGRTTVKTLDPDGKPRTVTDPNNNTVGTEYYGPEKEGRVKKQIDALGRVTLYDYDNNGNTVSVSDNIAVKTSDANRTTLTFYDELNRAIRMVAPKFTHYQLGAMRPVTRFTYDNLGNITKVEAGYTLTLSGAAGADVMKVQYSYTYDDFGRKLTEKDGLNKTWSYVYDANNNITQIADPKGQVITFDYYYGGLIKTQKVYLSSADANPAITTYVRNDMGQVTSVGSPAVTYTYSFDPTTNRLASVTDTRAGGTQVKTLSYAYTKAGRIKRVQTAAPGNADYRRTDYLRDPTGSLAGIWAPNDDLVTFVYDQGGRLTEKWLAVSSSPSNSLKTRYAWNADNTLSTLRNLFSNDFELTKNEYVYNDVAQRVGNLEVSNGLAAGAVHAAYQYDWLNNRVVATDLAGINTYYYAFDDANQLTSVRTGSETGTLVKAFIYDANGNMIQKCEDGTITVSANSCTGTTVTSLSYDPLNRLTGVTKTGLSAQSYTYDDQGRRIAETVGTATTYYVYDGDNIAAEYGSDWTTAAAFYAHGPNTDQPLFRSAGVSTKYYHQDGLGSVVAVNLNGIIAGQLFDAWGNVIKTNQNGASPIPQYGYTGREPDETGLIYYRARYYDPAIGRFVQRDPIGLSAGINLYAYVMNNPVNHTDPSGNCVGPLLGGICNVGFGLGLSWLTGANYSLGQAAFDFGVGAATSGLAAANAAAKFAKMGMAEKGLQGEALAEKAILGRGDEILGRQVTIQTPQARTRIDFAARNPLTDEIYFVEAKNGASAKLSSNQSKAFPAIEEGFGVARGKNADEAGLTLGTALPPTRVEEMYFNTSGYQTSDYLVSKFAMDSAYQSTAGSSGMFDELFSSSGGSVGSGSWLNATNPFSY